MTYEEAKRQRAKAMKAVRMLEAYAQQARQLPEPSLLMRRALAKEASEVVRSYQVEFVGGASMSEEWVAAARKAVEVAQRNIAQLVETMYGSPR